MLLIGISCGVVLATTAGARRTDSAFGRFLETSHVNDLDVQYSSEDPIDDDVLAAVRRQPGIESATPIYWTIALPEGGDFDLGMISSPDDAFLREVNRPRVLQGRLPNPDAPDEVLANTYAADILDVGVGDTLSLATFSNEQFAGLDEGSFTAPAGPTLDLTVVGIGRLPFDLADPEFAGLFATPAFHRQTWGIAGGYGPQLQVRTRPGGSGRAAVEAALEPFALDELNVTEQAAQLETQIGASTQAVAVGLMAFAGTAALAALVACGQALTRRVGQMGADQPTLRAIGLTRARRMLASMFVVVPAIIGGAIVAVLVAVLASPLLPMGTARQAEPNPGLDVDAVVLGIGALGVFAALLVVSAASARRSSSTSEQAGTHVVGDARARTSIGRFLRRGSSPAVQLGVAMALEPGGGRTAVPVRSAIAGAVAGVAGIVAVLTFAASLNTLLTNPARYGWNWTLSPDIGDEDTASITEIPGVKDIGRLLHRQVVVGGEQMLGIAVAAEQGSPSLTIRHGRMPGSPDEVAVGPKLADRMNVHIGDAIEVADRSPAGTREMRVVGEVLFPTFDDNSFNDAVAVRPEVIDELAVSDGFSQVVVAFDDGISIDEAVERVTAIAPDSVSFYARPSPPPEVANLKQVRSLPIALAGYLAALALAAVAHALASGVRRRWRDIGVVRALGFVARDVRRTITTQAGT
ncbi:MAG: ABC transporter permease, partial [Acidimicrobiales bacterium]